MDGINLYCIFGQRSRRCSVGKVSLKIGRDEESLERWYCGKMSNCENANRCRGPVPEEI